MEPQLIPLSVPHIAGNEWTYLKECLDTNWVSSVGAYVDRFERDLAERVGTSHAVATVNGTAALHVSLLVAGVGAGDLVVVPALTFVAPANAVRYTGAEVAFVDVDPRTGQMNPAALESFFREHCERRSGATVHTASGKRVAAIIPVHILGHPTDMDPVMRLADEFALVVIEDATESIGASYKGRRVGSIGHLSCFSFNGNKLLTTGGGGMVATNNQAWAERIRYLTTQAKDDPIEYEHHAIGYNYRLTNLQAAMGCAQLEQLDGFIAKKHQIARAYDAAFDELSGIRPLATEEWAQSVHWLYTVEIDSAEFGLGSRELMRALSKEKIQTRPLWKPIPQNPPYAASIGATAPVAATLYERCLSLPCSVGLDETDQQRVIRSIRAIHQAARGAPAGS